MISPLLLYGQNDSIAYSPTFITYRQYGKTHFDTLNRIDKNGFRQGKWIEFDSLRSRPCWTTIYCKQTNDSDYIHRFKDSCEEEYWSYEIKWSGLYFDNKKQGLWINSYISDDSRIEIFYKDGIVQFPIIEYLRGYLYKATIYDPKTKKFKWSIYDESGNATSSYSFEDIELVINPDAYFSRQINKTNGK